jgi:YD repeat-containing protein
MPFQAAAGVTNFTTPSTTAGYDALGRVLTVVDGSGVGTVSNTYTQNDVLSALTPVPSGEFAKQTQTEYDGLGRVKSVCESFHAGGGTSCSQATGSYSGIFDTYSYTSASWSTTVSVTRGGQTRSTTYDPLGRPISITTPESGTTTYTYDSYPAGVCGGWTNEPGNLMLITRANGTAECFVHADPANRLTDYGGGSTCDRLRYDSVSNAVQTQPTGYVGNNLGGRVVEAETDTCAWPPTSASMITDEWFSYDKDGRVTDVWQKTQHSTQYYHSIATYFENGAVKTLQLASPSLHTITYGLDGEGRWNGGTR